MNRLNLLLGILTLTFFACNISHAQSNKVKGSGPIVTETLDLSNFSSIGLGISANVYLTQGSQQKVEVRGQKNIIDILKIESKDNTLNIGTKKNHSYSTSEKLEVHVTMKDLTKLNLGGSGSIIGETQFTNLDDVKFNIGGSGSIKLDLQADEIDCNIGGSGSMKLSGQADEIEVNIGGSGSVKAIDLQVKNADVNTAGSGSAMINVSDHISARIAGSGGIKYKGDPKIDKKIVGSGRIKAY